MRVLAQHPDGFEPQRSWEDLEVLQEGDERIFKRAQIRRRSPHTGREHVFTLLECPQWINVIAFRAPELGGELMAVEQFRHGAGAPTLEIVGGVSEAGEAPAETARRELLEETGHEAGTWISLGSCRPNPAFQDNRCHFFLALDCRPVRDLSLDPTEELRIWAVPWAEWQELLREGRVEHALVLAAHLKLMLWEGWPALRQRLEAP